MNNALVWRPRITVSQMQLKDVSEKTWEISETSLRRRLWSISSETSQRFANQLSLRRPWDAVWDVSEIHLSMHCEYSSLNTPRILRFFLKKRLRKTVETIFIYFNVMVLHFKIQRRILQHPVKHLRCFFRKLIVRCLTEFRIPLLKKTF